MEVKELEKAEENIVFEMTHGNPAIVVLDRETAQIALSCIDECRSSARKLSKENSKENLVKVITKKVKGLASYVSNKTVEDIAEAIIKEITTERNIKR